MVTDWQRGSNRKVSHRSILSMPNISHSIKLSTRGYARRLCNDGDCAETEGIGITASLYIRCSFCTLTVDPAHHCRGCLILVLAGSGGIGWREVQIIAQTSPRRASIRGVQRPKTLEIPFISGRRLVFLREASRIVATRRLLKGHRCRLVVHTRRFSL